MEKHTEYEKILQRLMMEVGVFTATDLAHKLGYTGVSAVSNWKRRGIEWGRIMEKFPDLDVNYVKTGKRAGEVSYPESASFQKIKQHVEQNGVGETDRVMILDMIESRAETLERELGELRRLLLLLSRMG